MKELKDAMLQQNEVVLQREIARADSERMSIENDLQQLLVGSGIQKSEESELSKQALIEETRHRQASSDAFHEMCEQALSRVVFKRTGQKIKGVRATNHSTALAGFINTLGEELRIDQDISDVSADNWSIATAGVVKNVDFRTLRPSGF